VDGHVDPNRHCPQIGDRMLELLHTMHLPDITVMADDEYQDIVRRLNQLFK
jgi:hypothetical protein